MIIVTNSTNNTSYLIAIAAILCSVFGSLILVASFFGRWFEYMDMSKTCMFLYVHAICQV